MNHPIIQLTYNLNSWSARQSKETISYWKAKNDQMWGPIRAIKTGIKEIK